MSKESEEKEFQEIVKETMDIEKFKKLVARFRKPKTEENQEQEEEEAK